VLSARPKVAELVFQLYGRALHPELLEVYRSMRVERGDPEASAPDQVGYEARVEITSAGHVVTWRRGKLLLTEVAASAHQPMPEKRRLFSERIDCEHTEAVDCRGGVRYEVTFALETVTPTALAAYQKEIDLAALATGQGNSAHDDRAVLVHRFDTSARVGLGAMSYVDLQARDRTLRVRALHTFPDDNAIVRSQSLIRLPG
jgi:hypothetical protein